jgi:transposase
MRATTLLSILFGLKLTRVLHFELSADGVIVDVAPKTRTPRCSGCYRRAPRVYDQRPRLWRHLDLAGVLVLLRYSVRRVDCRRCGVLTELVPWAEHRSGFTREFEQTAAYLAQRADQTTVSTLLRVAWMTVGRIVARVVNRLGPADRLEGLTHIGIDELSYRKHHEYVTVVVDHLKGRVVWVHPGKNADTVRRFFAELGPERAAKLEAVTIDMSGAYIHAVEEGAPQARLIFDRFHVQRLAHDALDEVRREMMRELHGTDEADAIKKTRFALQKNPWNLTQPEAERISIVQRRNRPLYRAYLLKEMLAFILSGRQPNVARRRLLDWISWATHSRLAPFRRVARTIARHLDGIVAYVATRLSNGPSEGLNGKIRTITRRAYGFHGARSLIGFIFLCCSGLNLMPVRTTPSCAH